MPSNLTYRIKTAALRLSAYISQFQTDQAHGVNQVRTLTAIRRHRPDAASLLCIGHHFGHQARPVDARPRPRSVQGGRYHRGPGYVLVLGGLLKGRSIGPLVQQLFRQGLHGQARSTAATGKMFPRLVHLQLEVGFIFTWSYPRR